MDCSHRISPWWMALIQGQWISLLIAGTGVFATILSATKPSTNFPLLMNMMNYAMLSFFLVRKQCREDSKALPITETEDIELNGRFETDEKLSLLWYVGAAILDVEANYLVLLAYNYTTITSVMLLDCFTIPVAMVLSYCFLGCRYTWRHLVGTAICLSGLLCIVINDALNAGNQKGNNPVLGDIYCLCGAVLYASSNVLQEHLVKFHDREEFLGRLGGYGFLLAFVQCMVLDLPGIRTAHFTWEVVLSILGFVVCLCLMYVNTSSFLQHSDAILFNLSLLTSDVYAVVFSYFFYGYLVDWLYFLSFALVLVGLCMYHTEKQPAVVGDGPRSQDHQLLLAHGGSPNRPCHLVADLCVVIAEAVRGLFMSGSSDTCTSSVCGEKVGSAAGSSSTAVLRGLRAAGPRVGVGDAAVHSNYPNQQYNPIADSDCHEYQQHH